MSYSVYYLELPYVALTKGNAVFVFVPGQMRKTFDNVRHQSGESAFNDRNRNRVRGLDGYCLRRIDRAGTPSDGTLRTDHRYLQIRILFPVRSILLHGWQIDLDAPDGVRKRCPARWSKYAVHLRPC